MRQHGLPAGSGLYLVCVRVTCCDLTKADFGVYSKSVFQALDSLVLKDPEALEIGR